MKDIRIYKLRLDQEFNTLERIKYEMQAEIAHAAQKAAERANRRSARHIRNANMLSRIIEDYNLKIEIENLTFTQSVIGGNNGL